MKKYLFTVVGGAALLPLPALAADLISPQTKTDIGKTGLGTLRPTEIVGSVLNVLLGFLAIVALGLFLWAGFQWMTAAGNEDKITSAKSTLVAAAIGLLIILSSWGITLFLFSELGTATGTPVQTP